MKTLIKPKLKRFLLPTPVQESCFDMSSLDINREKTPAGKFVERRRSAMNSLQLDSSELSSILSDIDFRAMSRVFQSEYNKSRVRRSGRSERPNFGRVFVNDYDVRFVRGTYTATEIRNETAIADILTNTVYFETDNFLSFRDEVSKFYFSSTDSTTKKDNVEYANALRVLTRSLFLLTLTHELAHRVTQSWRGKGAKGNRIVILSAMHHQEILLDKDGKEIGVKDDRMAGLKEAVTRKLQLELAVRYLNTANLQGVSEESLRKVHDAMMQVGTDWKNDDEQLDRVIRALAEKSGLPTDAAWGGFKEAYFRNRKADTFQNDLTEFTGTDIRDAFPDNFLARLFSQMDEN